MNTITTQDAIIFVDKLCYVMAQDNKKSYDILFVFSNNTSLRSTYSYKAERDIALEKLKDGLHK